MSSLGARMNEPLCTYAGVVMEMSFTASRSRWLNTWNTEKVGEKMLTPVREERELFEAEAKIMRK